jgi:hypothetical protein
LLTGKVLQEVRLRLCESFNCAVQPFFAHITADHEGVINVGWLQLLLWLARAFLRLYFWECFLFGAYSVSGKEKKISPRGASAT